MTDRTLAVPASDLRAGDLIIRGIFNSAKVLDNVHDRSVRRIAYRPTDSTYCGVNKCEHHFIAANDSLFTIVRV